MKGTVFSTVFLLTVAALLMSMFLAISYGAKEITLSTVWTTLINYDPSDTSHQIIHELRLPRVLGAALIGAAFAVAGALMQGVTRNPLADAGILGVNAGATFVVALSFAFFPNLPYSWLMVVSFLGAVMSTVFIFLLGSSTPGGLTPLRLTVAGSVVAALLHSLSSGIAIYFELSQDLAFWYAGGLAGIKWMHLKWLTPVVLLTLLWTPLLGRSISAMALGNDVASNLGIKTKRVQVIAIIVSVILAGVSVSAVGSIGFVGLVIPHMARKLVGVDYRLIVPLSAVMGAVLLVLADLGARMVNPPKELAISVMVAMVGVPFFLYLARRERGSY
ncbi:FecCD family ABC transporter permease [Brevibacillus centrosporus]|uniref:Iron complex transport system permease protein n=1 Tax=Brevibacillus centrosporus TaxID=54910 RepID=A0A1I3YHJ6_9BACL|nr:iron ABC transporter permease [Brevibacillus centrosporus]MED4910544.1 iron ABC transporter permease [Brevibacillus centrosporus]SFK31275.1 iron complex transport system permease protein [Brevibacillus centrosporus]